MSSSQYDDTCCQNMSSRIETSQVPVEARFFTAPRAVLSVETGAQPPADTNLSKGFYADAERTNGYIIKKYGQKSGLRTMHDARKLAGHMERFDDIAEDLKVRTARAAKFEIGDGDQGVELHEYAPHVGPDLKKVLERGALSEGQVLDLVEQMVEQHGRVARAGYPITLDAVVANFCLDEKGEVVYIDKMPPRQRLADGSYLSEIPVPEDPLAQDVVVQRHFTGHQSKVIHTQLLRGLTPPHLRWAAHHLKPMIGEHLGAEAYSHIDLGPIEVARMLSAPEVHDTDSIRRLGWEAYHDGVLGHDDAARVHHMSHIDIGGILPPTENLIEAAGIIYEAHARAGTAQFEVYRRKVS